jgi:hypothetical protein
MSGRWDVFGIVIVLSKLCLHNTAAATAAEQQQQMHTVHHHPSIHPPKRRKHKPKDQTVKSN